MHALDKINTDLDYEEGTRRTIKAALAMTMIMTIRTTCY